MPRQPVLQSNMLAAAVTAAYGVFLAVGGVIGYRKARSTVSLWAGTGAGLVLLVCASLMDTPARGTQAAAATVLIAVALGWRFFGAWRRRRRVMPELITVVLSVLTMLVVGAQLVSQ